MMKSLYLTLITLVSATSLHAASVNITNHSFETGAGLPATWNTNVPDGWTRPSGGGTGLQNVSAEGATGSDGDYVVFIQTGSLAQDITGSILGNSASVGDVFTLTVAATNQNGAPDFEFDIQDDFGFSLIGGPVTSTTALPANPAYTDAVLTGTVDTASPVALLVIQRTGGQVRIDNVRLDHTQVPEPSSTALLGLGGLALILRRKK